MNTKTEQFIDNKIKDIFDLVRELTETRNRLSEIESKLRMYTMEIMLIMEQDKS